MDYCYRAWRAALYLITGYPDIPNDIILRASGCSGYSHPFSLGGELEERILGEVRK